MNADALEQVQQLLGRRFRDVSLLADALTHASIASSRARSNERLEFLGDAVLALLVCEHLYRKRPAMLEGEMTKIKSAAVSRRTCAQIARSLGLDEVLRLGKGMLTQEELPYSVPAAALEAVLGAVYLDGGLDAARQALMPHLGPIIDRIERSGHQLNFKSALQQHTQRTLGESPVYILLDEQGPDHDKAFEVCAQVQERRFPSAWGKSKKQAEQRAALNALRELGLIRVVEGEEVIASDEDGCDRDQHAQVSAEEDQALASND